MIHVKKLDINGFRSENKKKKKKKDNKIKQQQIHSVIYQCCLVLYNVQVQIKMLLRVTR